MNKNMKTLFDTSKEFWNNVKFVDHPIDSIDLENYISDLMLEYDELRARSYRIVGDIAYEDFSWENVFKYRAREFVLLNEKIMSDFDYKALSDVSIDEEIKEMHPFDLPGILGTVLQAGGAYTKSRKDMKYFYSGLKAAIDFSKNDLNDLIVYASDSAWNSFFTDVAWDKTFMIYRKSDKVMVLILSTSQD